ncbi:glycosyltransferase [bacterium]|nr:glycosyltransferase [bacterium]
MDLQIFILFLLLLASLIYFSFGFYLLYGLLKRSGKQSAKQKENLVSVIVAARNEEQNLLNLLACLEQQTYKNFEVIVANDRSTDETQQILEEKSKVFPNLKFVTIETCKPKISPKKNALSLAISRSKGEILLFTDADCCVGKNWISGMLENFSGELCFVIGFSSFLHFSGKNEIFQNLQSLDFLILMAAAKGSNKVGLNWACTGQNLGYTKKLYEKIGGFEKIQHRISGDDVLMLQLAKKVKGSQIIFSENTETFATSFALADFESFWNQRKRWASNSSFQFLNNPLFFLYLFGVSLLHSSIILGFVFDNYFFTSLVFGFKFLFDLVFTFFACKIFAKKHLLKLFPLWFVLQFPYVIFVGFFGFFSKFKWKG